MTPRILIATGNPGKLAEIERLLDLPWLELVSPAAAGVHLDVDETGTTYAENAILKAAAYSHAAGIPALADDSGIEVDALGGRPGLHSARYGGPGLDDASRVQRLLAALGHATTTTGRSARFRAVVAIAGPSLEPVTFEGVVEGRIALAPRGESGFGYDPVFELPDGRTAAQLSANEKDARSHRGTAVRKAAIWLDANRARLFP